MSSIRIRPSAEDCHEEGFKVLRHCVTECYQFLQEGFQCSIPIIMTITTKERHEELAKTQLQRYSTYTKGSIKSFEKVWLEEEEDDDDDANLCFEGRERKKKEGTDRRVGTVLLLLWA